MANANDTIFARDKGFWDNYLRGRPRAPDVFFERIFRYHEESGGQFSTAHDAGAGNGPYAQILRSKFQHVIISDIVSENVELAKDRLRTDNGFTYRVAKIEEASDIPSHSVDLVFATNVVHFADQELTAHVIANQLKSNGTFVAAGFGPARFVDPKVQEAWSSIYHQGGRAVLKKTDQLEETIKVMERSSNYYNVVPLDEKFFKPGAKRIHLNMDQGGLTALLPPEYEQKASEPDYTGPKDVVTFEKEDGWNFKTDLDGLKEHFKTFPFSAIDPSSYDILWQELEGLLKDGQVVEGYFPAKIILAKRR
ncbi:hypothetical protein TCE0_033r08200 [Talaromyces pinophilus]|uniref:Methyltransferase type 11 domain-containing protein n=1 Tax=Talaromyces pinophilus TaxID=128442 RepID=A0A6V8HC25_TALPI|nr:hypothetical protein TCE0_033r08200 [Talaromyces pinophilus]